MTGYAATLQTLETILTFSSSSVHLEVKCNFKPSLDEAGPRTYSIFFSAQLSWNKKSEKNSYFSFQIFLFSLARRVSPIHSWPQSLDILGVCNVSRRCFPNNPLMQLGYPFPSLASTSSPLVCKPLQFLPTAFCNQRHSFPYFYTFSRSIGLLRSYNRPSFISSSMSPDTCRESTFLGCDKKRCRWFRKFIPCF